MRFKFNPLTFEQKLALRRSAEDAINAMNPHWGEFRKAATAPAIISLLDSLDEMTTYRDNAVKKIMQLRERITELEKQNLEKPSWDSHNWPQIVQSAGGHWFGVKAGWEMSVHNDWKGDELCLLSDDGEFLKYGNPSANWRQSLEQRPETTPAITNIIAERQRQISAEGWTSGHDDTHVNGELALAAAEYAIQAAVAPWDDDVEYTDHEPGNYWPWDVTWWKPTNQRRDLVKAGALILAEIERLDRISNEKGESHE